MHGLSAFARGIPSGAVGNKETSGLRIHAVSALLGVRRRKDLMGIIRIIPELGAFTHRFAQVTRHRIRNRVRRSLRIWRASGDIPLANAQ